MRYCVIALVLFCSVGLGSVSAEIISRVAAVVNNDIITTLQLDQKLQELLAKKERQPSPAQLGALRQELLSRMIEETLVQQRIKALNLTVSAEELETAILDVQKKNKLTRDELEEAVLAQGMEFSAYRENLNQQILRMKLISQEVRRQVDVPDREVEDYFNAHLDDYRLAPEVKLSAISFPVSEKASEQERQQSLRIAEEALVRLRQGEELSQVVAAFEGTYGASGGELGRFDYTEMTPAFTAAINGVDIGGFSEPVSANNTIYLLRVDERFSGGVRQFDEVKYDIYQEIMDQKTDTRIKEWTKALKAKSFIDIRL